MDELDEQRVTLHDVAEAAGVAVSTVSRALTKPGRVSEATRTRIERIAHELGYVVPRRSPHGRAIRSVAVAVAEIRNHFYSGVMYGTQQELTAVEIPQLVINTEGSGRVEAQLIESYRPFYDGLILTSSRLPEEHLVRLGQQMPLIVMNRKIPGLSWVHVDTPGGSSQAVDHLVSLGHREIIYAAGPANSYVGAHRWSAIEAAARAHGIRATRIGPFAPTREAGPAAADAVLNTGATACMAFNDLLAIGMLDRLRSRGVEVPGEISIVGCDDIFGADFCSPSLTTIASPGIELGRVAVSMLLALPRGPVAPTELPATLVIRGSTGVAREPGGRPGSR